MNSSILLNILCFLILFTTPSNANYFPCKSAKCNLLSPEIQSPFRIQGIHPHQCGLSKFTLFCNHENQTTIRLIGHRDLFVKAISYDTRRLSLVDPKNCVHEVFLNLNLSLTHFSYYHAVHRYKYANCSSKLVGIEAVPCLSGSSHHVYVVEPSLPLPVYCSAVKTVAIPFSYSPYLSDSSFGLGLTWRSTRADEAEYNYKVVYAVLGIMAVVFIFIVGKVSYANYGSDEKVEAKLGQVESDYEALDTLRL